MSRLSKGKGKLKKAKAKRLRAKAHAKKSPALKDSRRYVPNKKAVIKKHRALPKKQSKLA